MRLFAKTIAIVTLSFVSFFEPSIASAAGTYACKGQTSFGKFTFKFKNGRVRAGSFSLEHKVEADGSVRVSYQGEYGILTNKGTVLGRGGAKTGPHDCDMAKVREALKK